MLLFKRKFSKNRGLRIVENRRSVRPVMITIRTISVFLTIMLMCAFPTSAISHDPQCSVEVVRVVDGDTLVVRSLTILGGPEVVPIYGYSYVRLLRVDTPERRKPGFEEAKILLQTLVKHGIALKAVKRDSFGRWLAELSLCLTDSQGQVERKSINDILAKRWPYER